MTQTRGIVPNRKVRPPALSERLGSRAVGAVGMALCMAAIAALSAIALAPAGSLVTGLSAFALCGATGVLRQQPQLKVQSGRNCRHDSRRTVSLPTTSAS